MHAIITNGVSLYVTNNVGKVHVLNNREGEGVITKTGTAKGNLVNGTPESTGMKALCTIINPTMMIKAY